MAQTKEQNKPPGKELHNTEIPSLSDTKFKPLVIRTLRELTEYSKSIREEIKATLSEINKNPQVTNSKGEEASVQINNLSIRKK